MILIFSYLGVFIGLYLGLAGPYIYNNSMYMLLLPIGITIIAWMYAIHRMNKKLKLVEKSS